MTTTTLHGSTAESTLRTVMLTNTALSATTGLIGAVFGGAVADALGVEQAWLVRLLSAGLVSFAAVVFLVARSSQPLLQRWSRDISFADFGWVMGTIAVIALGWLSTSGAIIMLVIGFAVFGLGLAQYRFRALMIGELAARASST